MAISSGNSSNFMGQEQQQQQQQPQPQPQPQTQHRRPTSIQPTNGVSVGVAIAAAGSAPSTTASSSTANYRSRSSSSHNVGSLINQQHRHHHYQQHPYRSGNFAETRRFSAATNSFNDAVDRDRNHHAPEHRQTQIETNHQDSSGFADPETIRCRQMASSLVDNMLAKAIVKASQELAFTHASQRSNSLQLAGKSNGPVAADPSMIADNENPPEIQIDLVGPRTPSPIEESSVDVVFANAAATRKPFKFRYDAESMCNADEFPDMSDDSSGIDPQDLESSFERQQAQQDTGSKVNYYPAYSNNNNNSINELDVATTPEMQEIDLAQAQQISKHIVTDIINQAVNILNKENIESNNNNAKIKLKTKTDNINDNNNNNNNKLLQQQQQQQQINNPGNSAKIKRETESFSKLSCHSSRSAAAGDNCGWINRARHALSRIMRNACLCTKNNESFHV